MIKATHVTFQKFNYRNLENITIRENSNDSLVRKYLNY